jgi:hypothetical protein
MGLGDPITSFSGALLYLLPLEPRSASTGSTPAGCQRFNPWPLKGDACPIVYSHEIAESLLSGEHDRICNNLDKVPFTVETILINV